MVIWLNPPPSTVHVFYEWPLRSAIDKIVYMACTFTMTCSTLDCVLFFENDQIFCVCFSLKLWIWVFKNDSLGKLQVNFAYKFVEKRPPKNIWCYRMSSILTTSLYLRVERSTLTSYNHVVLRELTLLNKKKSRPNVQLI